MIDLHGPTPPEPFTSLPGAMIRLRIDTLELARHLELDPERWPDAEAAYRIAAGLADVTRQAFR